jgi:hypothetical protein
LSEAEEIAFLEKIDKKVKNNPDTLDEFRAPERTDKLNVLSITMNQCTLKNRAWIEGECSTRCLKAGSFFNRKIDKCIGKSIKP